jgi:hypothetical protein
MTLCLPSENTRKWLEEAAPLMTLESCSFEVGIALMGKKVLTQALILPSFC